MKKKITHLGKLSEIFETRTAVTKKHVCFTPTFTAYLMCRTNDPSIGAGRAARGGIQTGIPFEFRPKNGRGSGSDPCKSKF